MFTTGRIPVNTKHAILRERNELRRQAVGCFRSYLKCGLSGNTEKQACILQTGVKPMLEKHGPLESRELIRTASEKVRDTQTRKGLPIPAPWTDLEKIYLLAKKTQYKPGKH